MTQSLEITMNNEGSSEAERTKRHTDSKNTNL